MAKTNQQIIVTEGDFGVEILTQFIDTNKKLVPIEGCSCKVKFAYDGKVISEKTGIVIDEPKGIVSVILDKEETQYSGLWTSYWICYDQSNNVTTTENIYYYVQPAIGSVNNPALTELLNYYKRDEVNDMFKNILEQLNNYTLSREDVEEYINTYIQDKVDDDFVKQCILDAVGNGSDYAKKQDVTTVSNNLYALSQRVDRYNKSLEQEDINLSNDIETINLQLDTITHLTDRKNDIQEDINKAYEKNKIFSLNKGQYNINTLTLKSNVYELKGVVFNVTEINGSIYNIVIEDNCIIDELNIKFSGNGNIERLVQIKGNVKIGKINIIANKQKGINNDSIDATLVLNGDNIYIDDIVIKSFDYSIAMYKCTNLNIKNINIQSFVRGVYIRTCKDVYINYLHTSINSPNATFNPGHNGLLIEESENINIPYINISDCGEHGIRLGATRDGVYSQKDFNFGKVILKRCGRCGFKALTSEDNIIKNINIDELITIDVNYNGSAGDNKDSLRLEGVEDVVVGRINAKKELNTRSCSNIVYITNAKHVLIDSVVGNNTAKEGILITDERGPVNDLFIKNINLRATDLELIKVNHKTGTLRDILFTNIYGREFKSKYGINLLVGTVSQPIILDGYINKGSQTGIYHTDAGTTSLQKIANKLIEI